MSVNNDPFAPMRPGATAPAGAQAKSVPERSIPRAAPAAEATPVSDPRYANTASEVRKKTQRVPLHLVCPAGVAHEAQAMRDGFLKYGYASYLNDNVKITINECIGAAQRHLEKLKGGVDFDPSGAHHAGHARAMLGILLECLEKGSLIDDRHPAHLKSDHIEKMYDRMHEINIKRDSEKP